MTGRPRGAKEFQRLLQRHAAEIGQLPQRVMHLVRVGVVCAMLDEVRHPDGGHLFIIKGGTAMQLRLGIRARATTDLDVVFAGYVGEWLSRFDEATADRAWNGFTIARKAAPTQIEVTTTGYRPWRVPLQLRYEGREFGSIALEVAIDDTAVGHQDLIEPDGIALAAFEIDPPRLVPCLDVPHQIAQKLHACTEVFSDRDNDRFRDLIDLQLLADIVEDHEWNSVKAACTEVFAARGKHPWPPMVTVFDTWPPAYRALAGETGFAVLDVAEAAAAVAALIELIDRS